MALSQLLQTAKVKPRRWGKLSWAFGLALVATTGVAQGTSPVGGEAAAPVSSQREALSVMPPPGSQPMQVPLTVEYKEGNLGVAAEKVPLAQVLQEVARQTGIEVQGLERLQEEVSVGFSGLPLSEGLQKLLTPVNYLILEQASSQGGTRPAQVLVFGRRAAPPTQAIPSEEGGNMAADENQIEEEQTARLRALEAFARQGNDEALREALHDPNDLVSMRAVELLAERDRQGVTTLLLDMTRSDHPAVRAQALRLLHETGHADERTIVSALGTALADKDVRNYAIQALAERDGPEAMEYLRQAFHDPDPAVRRLVIESAAARDQSLPLLGEAVSDPDETIRSFANFWLEQVASEGGEESLSSSP
jgi:hypothetical protein